jgi:hypothetical protein
VDLVADREPLITDQRQQHIARPDCSGGHLDEVVAQLDRVDILETWPPPKRLASRSYNQPAG